MIDINKFTIKAQETLQRAQQVTGEKQHQQIEPEHFLQVMLEDREGIVGSILKKLGAPAGEIEQQIMDEIDRFPKVAGGVGQAYLSPESDRFLKNALKESHQLKDEYVGVEHMLLAFSETKSRAGEILKEKGIHRESILHVLQEIRGGQRVTDQNPEDKYQALKRYGRDLNDLALQGKMDPVIGRDDEIRRVLQVLHHHEGN